MKTALVFGASGQIGTPLVDRLHAHRLEHRRGLAPGNAGSADPGVEARRFRRHAAVAAARGRCSAAARSTCSRGGTPVWASKPRAWPRSAPPAWRVKRIADPKNRDVAAPARGRAALTFAAAAARGGQAATVLRPTLVYGSRARRHASRHRRGSRRHGRFRCRGANGLRQPVHADDPLRSRRGRACGFVACAGLRPVWRQKPPRIARWCGVLASPGSSGAIAGPASPLFGCCSRARRRPVVRMGGGAARRACARTWCSMPGPQPSISGHARAVRLRRRRRCSIRICGSAFRARPTSWIKSRPNGALLRHHHAMPSLRYLRQHPGRADQQVLEVGGETGFAAFEQLGVADELRSTRPRTRRPRATAAIACQASMQPARDPRQQHEPREHAQAERTRGAPVKLHARNIASAAHRPWRKPGARHRHAPQQRDHAHRISGTATTWMRWLPRFGGRRCNARTSGRCRVRRMRSWFALSL